MLEAERRQLYAWDGRVPDQGLPLEIIDSLSAVAETTIEMDWPPLAPIYATITASQTTSKIQSISRALTLFFDQIVKMKSAEPQKGELPEISEPARPSQPRWTQNLYTRYRNGLVVSVKDLEQFKEFFWDYVSTEKPDFVWRAIGRFGWASDMAGELENLDYRFVDYVRSLEALLGGGPEIAHTLASRTAALIGGSHDDRQNTYDFIKAAYDCRSGSVHGEGLSPLKFRRWKGTLRGLGMLEEIDILHWYCRLSVRRVIDLVSAISKNEMVAAKWRLMSEKNKKHFFLGLLDYSLLRNDLAESIEAFYRRSVNIDTLWTKYEEILEAPFTHPLMFDKI
jgi:hypothetical protein